MGKMYRRWDKFEVQDVIARYLSGEDVQAIVRQPQRVGGLGRRELRSVHQARRMRAVRRDHGGVHRRRAGAAVGRQADRMSI